MVGFYGSKWETGLTKTEALLLKMFLIRCHYIIHAMNIIKLKYYAAGIFFAAPSLLLSKDDARPNILIILADDLGYSILAVMVGK